MANPFLTLLRTSFRTWASTRGFALVVIAGLLPMAFTGAYVATHQADLVARDIGWSPQPLVEGDVVNFTGTFVNNGTAAAGPFNATMAVGSLSGSVFQAETQNTTKVPGLAPGASATATVQWTARGGVFWALLDVDPEQAVGDKEPLNNQKPVPFLVDYALPNASAAPPASLELNGSANASTQVDASVTGLAWTPQAPKPGDLVTYSATVRNDGPGTLTNASASLRVGRSFGATMVPSQDTTRNVTLGPGQTQTLTLTWQAVEGAYWVEAYVSVPSDAHDTNGANNRLVQPLAVQPTLPPGLQPPTPPQRVTLHQFYLGVITGLQFRLILPFVALFFAAGVLVDERSAGSLPYLLSRPIPRWTLPLARFTAGFLVAFAGLAVGVLGTFLLVLGTSHGDEIGYLTTMLEATAFALLTYGAVFTIFGVWTARPYLYGLAFAAWEALATPVAVGLAQASTVAPTFVAWVQSLTLQNYVIHMLYIPAATSGGTPEQWPFDQGVVLLPPTAGTFGALVLLLVIAAAALGFTAWSMRQREFDV